MTYTFSIISFGYIISASLCLIVALVAWYRRKSPGSISFMLMMFALSVWSIAIFFELSAEDLETDLFWLTVADTAQNLIGPLMFNFVIHFTRIEKRIKKSILWLIWLIPIISLALTLTNDWHGLVFSNIRVQDTTSGGIIAVFDSGPVVYIVTACVFFMVLLGLYWLIRYLLKLGRKGVISAVLVSVASLIVMGIFVVYIGSQLIEVDITPLTFSFLSLVLFWSITQEQLFSIKPVAYKTLLDNMPDGVIVLNNDNTIIKANQSALNQLNISYSDLFGNSIEDVAPYLCEDLERCFEEQSVSYETILPGSDSRIVRLQMQLIFKNRRKSIGKIIQIQDITALKRAEEELNKKYAFTETLVNTTADINTTLSLDNVLNKILENAAQVVPYDAADIVLKGDDGRYRFACVRYFNDYHPTDFLLGLDPMSENLYGFEKMVETGKALIIPETKDNPDWNPIFEDTMWIRSYLGVPIRHQGKVIGFINLNMGVPNAFNKDQAQQIQVFANYAASAISNANLFDEVKRIAQELAVLNEISQVVNSGTGLDETIQAIFRQLKLIIPVDEFGITLCDPDSEKLDAYLYRGDGSRIDKEPFNIYDKSSLSRYIMEKKKTEYFPDIYSKDSIFNFTEADWVHVFSSHSLLGVPLVRRGEMFGVLLAGSNRIDAYTTGQIELVETIAIQSSTSIDNARLYEEVQKASITDGLTGLDNRHHFNLLIDQEIERTIRYKRDLCMIMLDIDHFKNINDRYGHVTGDLVLQHVATMIEKYLRKADIAFRYGGEEFIILLPETDLKSGSLVAERIRSLIEEQACETDHSKVYVTVSLGVCNYQADFTDSKAFVDAADQALYSSKSGGRNLVSVYRRPGEIELIKQP